MRYRLLGETGLKISRVIVGGSHIGAGDMDQERTQALVHGARDLGVNTFYASDTYSDGRAMAQLGRALSSVPREEVVYIHRLGMRYREPMPVRAHFVEDDSALQREGIWPTTYGLHAKHLRHALDRSLKTLGMDYVDVLSAHTADVSTPLEETLEVYDSFVRAGKALYIGCASGWPAWRVHDAHRISETHGLAKMRLFQSEYNLFNRWPEREQLPACQAAGVGVVAFNPLAGELLTGELDVEKRRAWAGPGIGRRLHVDEYATPWCEQRTKELLAIASQAGRSPAELAQGWVLAHPGVTTLAAGPNEASELDSAAAVIAAPLEDSLVEALTARVAMRPPGSATHAGPVWQLT